MSKEELAVSDADFEQEVLKSDLPVLVDFWAPWCGPCRILSPIIEEIAVDYDGRVKIRQMNVDDHKATATTYGIRSIPTTILFKGGQEVGRQIGAVPKQQIVGMLEGA